MSTATPAPTKAKRPKWHYIAGAVGALVLCGIVGNMLPDKDDKTASVPSGTGVGGAGNGGESVPAKKAPPTDVPPTAAPAGIGDAVTSGDLSWTVAAIEDKGQSWKGQFGSETTAGRFLKVDLSITNNGKDEVSLFSQPTIKDAKGREFKATDKLMMVIGSDAWCTAKALPAGVPQTCTNGYELPADATGLTLVVNDGGLVPGDEQGIDLEQ